MISHVKQAVTQHSDQVKHIIDGLSVGTVLGAIVGLLPAIAAVFTIAWTGIRIYETKTVQRYLRRRRRKGAK